MAAVGGGGAGLQASVDQTTAGRITALDLNKGEMVGQIARGETPDNIKNRPALSAEHLHTGRQGRRPSPRRS